MRKVLIILPLMVCTYANADDCESIVALSRVVQTTTQNKGTVESNANYFCSEYSKGTSTSSDMKFGAAFKFLSASYGNSNATVTDVASKYCKSGQDSRESNDAYRQYIESIAPGAYESYQQCIKMKNDTQFNVDSVLPKEFSISIGFASSDLHTQNASLAYSTSDGVTCAWNDSKTKSTIVPSGATTFLECKRSNQTQRSYVKVIRTDTAKNPPLTLNWQAYNDQGFPVDTLSAFDNRLKNIEMEISQQQQYSVIGFMSDNCPSGWVPVPNAQGRFLRGIDSSGSTTTDPDGKRVPGSVQEDMIAKHTHTYQSGFHEGQSNNGTGADPNKKNPQLVNTDEGKSKFGELGSETRPKNMAVLFCTKIIN
ncbi:hypothetical protein [Buttiauxella noackiae]|uniref:hypothetical protein n=1 Tax=Buttiauxella noackiae TaxID=82992 RepID=UPI0023562C4E|nr:hypothetical protein [Buttiauxella noackiae]MCA1923236.1 hypothetical protein [Buttiauxella noackiae]